MLKGTVLKISGPKMNNIVDKKSCELLFLTDRISLSNTL